jgi:hypothetical protein
VQLHEIHMHAKYEVAIFNISKVIKLLPRLKFWDRMTDRPKTIYPLFFEEGGIHIFLPDKVFNINKTDNIYSE